MAGKGRVGWKGRAALAYIHTVCKQLVGTCYSAGSSGQCSVTTQMGDGGGRSMREGISVHIQLIHIFVQQKLIHLCKAITLQLEKTQNIRLGLVCWCIQMKLLGFVV